MASAFSVRRIVWSREAADAEVERLQQTVRPDRPYRYFWLFTYVDERPD